MIDTKRSVLFLHVTFVACLLLQRFGFQLGGGSTFLCLPVMIGMVGYMYVTGLARIRAVPLMLYLVFLLVVLLSTIVALCWPDPRVGISVNAVILVAANYVFFVFGPSGRFDSSKAFDIFLFYARICAVAGLLQYFLQYVGVKLFSFQLLIPALDPLLIEENYAFNPILAYGSDILRSNGFFLVEPSIFSQILVIAVAIEFFYKKNLIYMPVYIAAYLVCYSGTGLLGLAVALAILPFVAPFEIPKLMKLAIGGAAVLVALTFIAPEQVGSLAGRAGELSKTQSSGYARFVAQSSAWDEFTRGMRAYIGYGPGSTERSIFWTPGSGNPALKIFMEYGYLGLVSFFAMLIGTLWRRSVPLVSLLALSIFQLGGGNVTFSPHVVLFALLCIWTSGVPTLVRSEAPTRQGLAPKGLPAT